MLTALYALCSGLSALVIEDVTDGGDMVVVTARTREDAVPRPVCAAPTAKVHGYHGRTVTDVPVDARQVVGAPARATAGLRRPGVWEAGFRRTSPGCWSH